MMCGCATKTLVLMGDPNMGVFQNTVLRKVLLSVFQLPTNLFFFRDTRFDVFPIVIGALNVLCFYIFIILSAVSQHPPKSAPSCVARACLFTALFIMCATYSTKAKCGAVNERTLTMHDETPFGSRDTIHKIVKLYSHNVLQTLMIR
jgi:hypothetical protein